MYLLLKQEKFLKELTNELKKKDLTIATAESCTGGLIANTLTNISGSSEYFDRGVISYSNKAKMELLDVPEDLLKKNGAVSMQVAEAMANGIRKKSNVDIGIATTGIAGPTGGSKEKPVGLVYISISTKKDTFVKKYVFEGSRIENKKNSCDASLKLLKELIEKI